MVVVVVVVVVDRVTVVREIVVVEVPARQIAKELVNEAMFIHVIRSPEAVHEGLTTLVKSNDAEKLMPSTRIH